MLVGCSDIRDVASCPSKLPFADADLQSTTCFALCLLICTNLTPQFFGEPFSSSHSSVQQFLYLVNLNASTEACDKKHLRHAFTLAKKPLCLSANVENKDQECVKTCKHAAELSRNIALFPFAAPRPWATFPLDSSCYFRYAATMPSPGMPPPHSFTMSKLPSSLK